VTEPATFDLDRLVSTCRELVESSAACAEPDAESIPLLVLTLSRRGLWATSWAIEEDSDQFAIELLRYIVDNELHAVALGFQTLVVPEGDMLLFAPGVTDTSAFAGALEAMVVWARWGRDDERFLLAELAREPGRLRVGEFGSPADLFGVKLDQDRPPHGMRRPQFRQRPPFDGWPPISVAAAGVVAVSGGGEELAFARWLVEGNDASALSPEAACPCGSGRTYGHCHMVRSFPSF